MSGLFRGDAVEMVVQTKSPRERPPDERYGSGHPISQRLAKEMGLPPYSVKEIEMWDMGDGTRSIRPVFQPGYLDGGGMPFPPSVSLVEANDIVDCPHREASLHDLVAVQAFYAAVARITGARLPPLRFGA